MAKQTKKTGNKTNPTGMIGGLMSGYNAVKNQGVASALKNARDKNQQNNNKPTPKPVANQADDIMQSGKHNGGIGGEAVEEAVKTDGYKNTLSKEAEVSSDPEEIAANTAKTIKKKAFIKALLPHLGVLVPMMLLLFFIIIIIKAADSMIFSSNSGNYQEVVQKKEIEDNKNNTVFTKYEELYEEVNRVALRYHNDYALEIDRNLIIATLTAVIENDKYSYIEVADGASEGGEANINWDKLVAQMISKVELLAKYQIMVVYGKHSKCNNDTNAYSIKEIAENDRPGNIWDWLFGWWAYDSMTDKEENNKCTSAPNMQNYRVSVISTEKADYPHVSTGGVYYWNLIGQEGFIYKYYKDYLLVEGNDEKANYERNLDTILEIADDIYAYHQGLENISYCDKYKILEGVTITEVEVRDYGTYPLEDYVAGVMKAEFVANDFEAMKAFAILARTFGISRVGINGGGSISASSNDQNFKPSGIEDENIRRAVEATKGLVVARPQKENGNFVQDTAFVDNYMQYYQFSDDFRSKVFQENYNLYGVFGTVYDAFCPVNEFPIDGYYYLNSGQNSLPIEASYVEARERMKRLAMCPCNPQGPTEVEASYDVYLKYNPDPENDAPFGHSIKQSDGRDAGNHQKCWSYIGKKCNKTDLFGQPLPCSESEYKYVFDYSPIGGHGGGASQYGLDYFASLGYNMEELIKLFYDKHLWENPRNNIRDTYHVQIMRIESSLENNSCTTKKDGFPVATLNYSGDEVIPTSPNTVIIKENLKTFLENHGSSFEEYKKLVEDKVTRAGRGTGAAVSEAAIAMISSLDQTYGIKLPFGLSGEKEEEAVLNGDWGGSYLCAIGGKNTTCEIGLSNIGFVNTVLNVAGISFNEKTIKEWREVGERKSISTCDANKGDLLWEENALSIIVGKSENNSLYVATSKSRLDGIIIEEVACVSKTLVKPKYIIDMTNYYASNRN